MNGDTLFNVYSIQRWYLDRLMHGIDDADLAQQPGPVVNHPAWQLGHLAQVTDQVIALVGGVPSLDGAWSQRFAKGSAPVADRAAYPSCAELVATLDDRRNALATRCKTLGDADWNRPNPIDALRPMLPTLRDVTHFMMLTHESAHHGQLATWRHARGMPQALSGM